MKHIYIHSCGGGFDTINRPIRHGLSGRGRWHRTLCGTALGESVVRHSFASYFVVVVDIIV